MLNAGATIGAVRETDVHGHYLVRAELHTFLSDVIKRELKRKPEETERGLGLDRLEKRIREALMPYVLDTSDAVLQHLHPIDEMRGFTSEIFLNEVDQQHLRPVRNLLTAGSSLRVVRATRTTRLATTCTPISTRRLRASGRASWRWKGVVARPIEGGALGAGSRAIADRAAQRLLPNGPAMAGVPPRRGRAAGEVPGHHDRGAGTDAGRAAQGRGAGNRGQAVSAAQALKRQARTHHGLNEQLKLVESENNAPWSRPNARSLPISPTTRARSNCWMRPRRSSRKLLPALVLLPEGGLFDRLVGALEEAQVDAPLSGDEDVLLKRLRQLKDNLDSMNWSEEAAWARVHRQIGHLNDIGLQNISAGDGTGPTKH